jgi:hypothetical protein
MRCRRARSLLPLLAGGDLPERSAATLLTHVEHCAACAAYLRELRHSQGLVASAAETDTPPPLPPDFAAKVQQRIERLQPRYARATRAWPAVLLRRAPIVAAAAAAMLLVILGVAWLTWNGATGPRAPGHQSAVHPAIHPPIAVSWEVIRGTLQCTSERPRPIDSLTLPDVAGVFAVMHRRPTEGGHEGFVIDFCAESHSLQSFQSFPWLQQRINRLATRAGSLNNVYVAVCPMPDASRRDRENVERTLIKEFQPFFNKI